MRIKEKNFVSATVYLYNAAQATEQFGAREIAKTVLQIFEDREKGERDGIS